MNMCNKLAILGFGGHAKVVGDAAGNFYEKIIYVDDLYKEHSCVDSNLYSGTVSEYLSTACSSTQIIVGIGDNRIRSNMSSRINARQLTTATIVHKAAVISSRSKIGIGTVVLAGAIINTDSVIEAGCIVNTASSIDHHCRIGEFTHIGPGARLCGSVSVGSHSLIGAGSILVPGIKVGDKVTVGAGSVIIKDIPNYATVVGSPGRVISVNKM